MRNTNSCSWNKIRTVQSNFSLSIKNSLGSANGYFLIKSQRLVRTSQFHHVQTLHAKMSHVGVHMRQSRNSKNIYTCSSGVPLRFVDECGTNFLKNRTSSDSYKITKWSSLYHLITKLLPNISADIML